MSKHVRIILFSILLVILLIISLWLLWDYLFVAESFSGVEYWYEKTKGSVFKEYSQDNYIYGWYFSHHGNRKFKVSLEDVIKELNKGKGISLYFESSFSNNVSLNDFGLKIIERSMKQSGLSYSKLRGWWEQNRKYLYWSSKENHFVTDEEAKKTGVPTDEYRKTHPWPKEEEKDKPK